MPKENSETPNSNNAFDPTRIADMPDPRFPGGPNEDPGIRLNDGFIPGKNFGGLVYVHVECADPKERKIIPSPKTAIDPETGRVLAEGDVVILDTTKYPPEVVKHIGTFAARNSSDNETNDLVFRRRKAF